MEMARSPFVFFTLVLAMSLLVCFSASASTKYGAGELISTLDLNPSECPAKCDYRCSKTKHRKDYCMSFCIPCCEECHCVPSGFYGNKDECPCYRDKKTKEGKPKCP